MAVFLSSAILQILQSCYARQHAFLMSCLFSYATSVAYFLDTCAWRPARACQPLYLNQIACNDVALGQYKMLQLTVLN